MKTKPSLTKIIAVKTALVALCLGFASLPHLSAQSADVFQTLQSVTQSTNVGNSTQSPPDIEVLKSKPSRFAIGHTELYTAARIANLSMKERVTDPFGLYQDPEAKPKIVNTGPAVNKTPMGNLPPVPLAEIVKLIKITAIMVKEKSFQSEGQVFRESGEVSINFQGRTKLLKVIKVEPAQIRFKDVDSGEEVTLQTQVLPPGMSSGDDKIKPAGMVSPTENQPLNLEIK